MDFRRAKVILIAAFALLDAFLFWRVSADAGFASPSDRTGGTRPPAYLVAAGVELELPAPGRLPVGPPSVPFLSVRLEAPDGNALVQSFFRGRGVQTSRFPATGPTQAEIYRTADEELAVLRIGIVQYQRLSPATVEGSGAEVARRTADAFVQRLGGLPAGGRFDYVAPVPGGGLYDVRYVEDYKGLPLFPGYLDVEVDGHGVVSAKRYWLDVAAAPASGPARPTIPAVQALLQLAASVHASPQHPLKVIALDFGYYSLNYEAARQWQLVPVWRIRLDGGGDSYINAYTGLLEE